MIRRRAWTHRPCQHRRVIATPRAKCGMKKEAAAGPAVAAAGPAVAGLWVAPSKGRRGGLRGKFIEPETLQWWVCTGVCSTRPAPSALDLSHCLAPLCHQARPSPTPPWAMSARAPPWTFLGSVTRDAERPCPRRIAAPAHRTAAAGLRQLSSSTRPTAPPAASASLLYITMLACGDNCALLRKRDALSSNSMPTCA